MTSSPDPRGAETERVEVSLDDLCVIVETAVDRAGLYMDRPLYPCWERLPRRVQVEIARASALLRRQIAEGQRRLNVKGG